MTTPHIIMWAVAGCIGLPAAYRNPTAAAVTASWLAAEIVWMRTGNNLPLPAYVILDIAVMTVILAKLIVREGSKQYPTLWLQIRCMFFDLSVWDQCVLGLFLLGAWPIYLSTLHPYYQWWALYYIKLAQFAFVGMEPLTNWRLRRRAKRGRKPDNVLHFAPAYSRRVKRYFGAEPPPSHSSADHPQMRGGGGV